MKKMWTKDHPSMVMGILNMTPDSFSDGGKYIELEKAVEHAIQMAADGAEIIDIGAISTRPGHEPVSVDDERKRLLPAVRAVRAALPDIWISVDTWRSEVAEEAVLAGADFLNDQWGAKFDPRMADVAAKYQIPICLMHNRKDQAYTNFMENVKEDLLESIQICKDAGVPDELIILDPGFGFVKTKNQNLEVLRRVDELVDLGYEVLLGTSRKGTIGWVLDLPSDERVEGTGATVVYGVAKGCSIVRVHDVLPVARMVKMTDAITGKVVLDEEKG
ncbi:dihydropteroate synthase [Listeria kieliensis]